MANSHLTPTVIAKRMMMHLDNNLIAGNLVYRDYQAEFGSTKVGSSVKIRRPVMFSVTSGAVLDEQDITEGDLTLTVDQRYHIGFSMSDTDLTLTIDEWDERYGKPAAIKLANKIDQTVYDQYYKFNTWAGTAGQTINSHADFLKGVERMDVLAVPTDQRRAILSPADWHGLGGAFSALYLNGIAKDALTQGVLPGIGGVDVYMAQNVKAHTVGAHGGTPLTRGASQGVTYSSVKSSMTQTFATDGWTTNSGLKAGDVFTIADVYDVNPITKATLPHLKMFSIQADLTTNTTSSNQTTLTIYPALITTGPYQNVSADNGNDKTITMIGTASTNYPQNLLFHKRAIALAMVPLEQAPAGAGVQQSTARHKGLSLQYSAQYDITNARMVYRFDALWGVEVVDRRMGVRLSGTA
jgi:hypothetical protein